MIMELSYQKNSLYPYNRNIKLYISKIDTQINLIRGLNESHN